MNLGALFPENIRKGFANRNIDLGDAIFIEIEDIDANYPKFIIIIADNEQDALLGYVIINSEVNTNVYPSKYVQNLHVKIEQIDHSFLEHDSYANCSEIRSFGRQEIVDFLTENPDRAVGNINPATLRTIHLTISHARTISVALKKQFGFI